MPTKPIGIALVKIRWQAAGLASEDQDDIVWRRRVARPTAAAWLSSRRSRVRQASAAPLEAGPARPHAQVDVLPVVEARALHLPFIQREAERLDQMQRGAGSQAGPPGVAGVPVNLGMHEDDVNGALRHRRQCRRGTDRVDPLIQPSTGC